MNKYIYSIICLLGMFLGVSCISKQRYTEGTNISLGAYVPGTEGQIYGIHLINYLSGCQITTSTNTNMQITRNTQLSNNWLFGMMSSSETNSTTVILTK